MNEPGMPEIDVARWARCEHEALHGPGRDGRAAAGSIVAQTAYRLLRDEELENNVLDMGDIVLDSRTPAVADIPRQARIMRDAFDDALHRKGGYVVAFPGGARHAFFVDFRDGATGLAHLRTGAQADGLDWLRLGQHLAEFPDTERVDIGVIAHVPRARLDRAQPSALYTRDAGVLVTAAEQWRGRAERVLRGETALARPGPHCRRCRVTDCAVRPS